MRRAAGEAALGQAGVRNSRSAPLPGDATHDQEGASPARSERGSRACTRGRPRQGERRSARQQGRKRRRQQQRRLQRRCHCLADSRAAVAHAGRYSDGAPRRSEREREREKESVCVRADVHGVILCQKRESQAAVWCTVGTGRDEASRRGRDDAAGEKEEKGERVRKKARSTTIDSSFSEAPSFDVSRSRSLSETVHRIA